jgi:hypothetical protein
VEHHHSQNRARRDPRDDGRRARGDAAAEAARQVAADGHRYERVIDCTAPPRDGTPAHGAIAGRHPPRRSRP